MSKFTLTAVLHLPPLPGATNYAGARATDIADTAAHDAAVLTEAGFDAIMVQDASDMPQAVKAAPATIASLAVVGAAVRAATDRALGVIVGHNDGPASVAIAHAVDAEFVRVKVHTGAAVGPTGVILGCCHEVAQMKRQLGSDVRIWADVHETTSAPLADTGRPAAARQALDFGRADALVVTRDSGVGDAVDDIAAIRQSVGDDVPMYIGGRVTAATLQTAVAGADGAILGSVLKTGSADHPRVDPATAKALGAQARARAGS